MNAVEACNELFEENKRLEAIIKIQAENIGILKDTIKIQGETIELQERSLNNLAISAGSGKPAAKYIKTGNIIQLIPNLTPQKKCQ